MKMSETENEKLLLSEHITQMLKAQYRSIIAAAEQLDLNYESLEKLIYRNRFSEDDLKTLIPNETVESLRSKYKFTIGRKYQRVASSHPILRARFQDQIAWQESFPKEDLILLMQNKALRDRVVRIVSRECERFRRVLSGDEEISGAT